MSGRFSFALVLLLALPPVTANAQDEKAATDKPVMVMASSLAFSPIEVPGFASGLQIAVLSGDPNAASAYTLRLKFPAGYAFPPHWHPQVEHLTVLSGKFFLGMGATRDDAKLHSYGPGDFLVAPPRQPHFGRVEGETVIQLHGVGPFVIKLAGQE